MKKIIGRPYGDERCRARNVYSTSEDMTPAQQKIVEDCEEALAHIPQFDIYPHYAKCEHNGIELESQYLAKNGRWKSFAEWEAERKGA